MNHKFKYYEIDHNLLFVIQNYLGESTEEVLSSIYEIVNTVVTECLKSTRARQLNKRVTFYYKKSQLPIEVNCWTIWFKSHEHQYPGQPIAVNVEVKFPKKMLSLDPTTLENLASQKFEKSIGLRDEMTALANLEKPAAKLPRKLKGVL